jgi:formamidopyrimidine-DNA glycosylase
VPEGDTVFRAARGLDAALAGRIITTFDLRTPALALTRAVGVPVVAVLPVGKHLLMRLGDDRTLHSHLRMDGSWRVSAAAQGPRGGPAHEIRALVGNEDYLATGYRVHDLAMIATRDEHELIGHLGQDLLGENFDLPLAVARLLAEADRPIGDALLDQRVVAGIGNVYKCELLFLHRLDPWQSTSSVPDPTALLTDAVRLLKANCNRTRRSTTGWIQAGQQYYVYGRRGRACRRCSGPVVQSEQGDASVERVLYFCPRCQQVAAERYAAASSGGPRADWQVGRRGPRGRA